MNDLGGMPFYKHLTPGMEQEMCRTKDELTDAKEEIERLKKLLEEAEVYVKANDDLPMAKAWLKAYREWREK